MEILPLSSGVFIMVTDNATGRPEASKVRSDSGRGLEILEEFYWLFGRYHGCSISYRYVDLNPETNG